MSHPCFGYPRQGTVGASRSARWRTAGRLIVRDLQRLDSLVGIVLGAIALVAASVPFLRAQVSVVGTAWAWGIVGVFVLTQVGWYLALIYVRARPDRGGSTHDNRVLDEFLALVPTDGATMRFLCVHSFGVRFDSEILRPLEAIDRSFSIPERAFHDPEVESAKQNLLGVWRTFHVEFWPNVFMDDRPGDNRMGTKYALDYPDLQNTGIPEADRAYDMAVRLDTLA